MEGGALAWRLSLGISGSSLWGFACAQRTGCLPPQGVPVMLLLHPQAKLPSHLPNHQAFHTPVTSSRGSLTAVQAASVLPSFPTRAWDGSEC